MRLFRIIANDTGEPLIIDGQMDLSVSDLSVVADSSPEMFTATHPYEPVGFRVVEVIDEPDGLLEMPVALGDVVTP